MRRGNGFTIIEVLIALAVLGLVFAGVGLAVQKSLEGVARARETHRARSLALEIYEEIASVERDALPARAGIVPIPPGVARSTISSVLEYDGLDEDPPRDPLGNVIPGAEALRRRVSVRYVDVARPEAESFAPTVLVRVNVSVEGGRGGEHRISFLRSLR
jgi:prepilin-type N-terminal cleavage/methylation domain-containing protein